MTKLTNIAFAGLIALTATPLGAAESFQGPYVGVEAGWSKNKLGSTKSEAGPVRIDREDDTASAGIFIGSDFKLAPRIVAGAEVGLSLTESDGLKRRLSSGTVVSVDAERTIDLTGRFGYLVTDRTLAYVRGGYSNVGAETTLSDGKGLRITGRNIDGWTAGGGIERAINNAMNARLEYRYTDLGERVGRFDQHKLLFGVAYRF
jgi:outer membrane immunogenic protein